MNIVCVYYVYTCIYIHIYVCVSLSQSWWKANNYFNLLNIMHLISLMCFSKSQNLTALSVPSVWEGHSSCPEILCKHWEKTMINKPVRCLGECPWHPSHCSTMQRAGLSFGSSGVETTKGEQKRSQENGEGGGEIEREREILSLLLLSLQSLTPQRWKFSTSICTELFPPVKQIVFCKLALCLKRHTDEGYGENVK